MRNIWIDKISKFLIKFWKEKNLRKNLIAIYLIHHINTDYIRGKKI